MAPLILNKGNHSGVWLKMSTPDISHLTTDDLERIYEPAEDSFLLLDALEKDIKTLQACRPAVCLEIGSGSGICSTFLAREIGYPIFSLCTDINIRAAEVTRKTGQVNGVILEPIQTDLVGGLSERLIRQVDVLLFNPPYVVTPSEEVGSHGIEASWAGGERGREVMDRLFPWIPKLLSDKGVFYLVIIKENNQDEIRQMMLKEGLRTQEVMSRRSGPEFLSVLKIHR